MIYKKLAKLAIVGFSAIALSSIGSSSAQAVNLVENGNFTQFTINGTTPDGQPGELGSGTGYTTLSDWTYLNPTKSYDFLFTSSSNGKTDADTTGAWSPQGKGGYLKLWGTNDGGLNNITAPPQGGDFLAVDPVYQNAGSLSQTLTGLLVGKEYTVSFYDAAAEQSPYTGASNDQWQVKLGSQTQDASKISILSKGFSGWVQESLNFTATSTSEVLQFAATGGPLGEPPLALLGDVSVAPTPEPSSIFGLGAVIVLGLGAGLLPSKLVGKK